MDNLRDCSKIITDFLDINDNKNLYLSNINQFKYYSNKKIENHIIKLYGENILKILKQKKRKLIDFIEINPKIFLKVLKIIIIYLFQDNNNFDNNLFLELYNLDYKKLYYNHYNKLNKKKKENLYIFQDNNGIFINSNSSLKERDYERFKKILNLFIIDNNNKKRFLHSIHELFPIDYDKL